MSQKIMSNNRYLADTVDTSRVSLVEDHEVRFWTERFGTSRFALQRAVDKVGTLPSEVAIELAKCQAGSEHA